CSGSVMTRVVKVADDASIPAVIKSQCGFWTIVPIPSMFVPAALTLPSMARLVFVLLLIAPAIAQAWWNPEWKQREKVELNTSATGIETKQALSAIPVAVRLHSGNFTFAEAKPDGSDLRFVAADDKTVLKHYVERFDSANELAIVWVQVPTLAPG